jgi:hypothetical protein
MSLPNPGIGSENYVAFDSKFGSDGGVVGTFIFFFLVFTGALGVLLPSLTIISSSPYNFL